MKRLAPVGLLLAALLLAGGCEMRRDRTMPLPMQVAGGDARLGPQLMRQYGCNACHVIPGVRGANALVGPPLIHWSRRAYVAGLLPNTPENLVRFIHSPQLVHPQSAMPQTGISPDEARHVAAYLYTLR